LLTIKMMTGSEQLLIHTTKYRKQQKKKKKKKKKKKNRHYLTKNITVSVYITDLYSGVAGLHYSREG
ncbi:hypothetical protein ACOGRH_003182, partial [Shigella flexneri]